MKTQASAMPFLNSRGQGTVEYILLLVVIVALLVTFGARFLKPINTWASALTGPYLGCLLNKGVLPNLGSSEEENGCNGIMSDAKASLSAVSGSSAKDAGSLGGAGAKSGNNSDRSSDQNEVAASRNGESAAARANAARNQSNGRGMGARSGRGAEGSTDEAKQTQVAVPAAQASSKFYKSSRLGGAGGSSSQVQVPSVNRLFAAERRKLERREEKFSSSAVVDSEGGGAKPKLLVLKPSERKLATLEKEDEPLNLSRLIRYFIIVIIAIAIFVFLSGQILQITKSWEK